MIVHLYRPQGMSKAGAFVVRYSAADDSRQQCYLTGREAGFYKVLVSAETDICWVKVQTDAGSCLLFFLSE